MARKKNRQASWDSMDSYDEYLDAEAMAEQAAQPEVAKVSLEDFMIPEKVTAFVRTYEPCGEFDAGAEMFDDGRLREYFKAYVCGLGDPLGLYIEALKMASFRMDTSLATNEPAFFVRRKM